MDQWAWEHQLERALIHETGAISLDEMMNDGAVGKEVMNFDGAGELVLADLDLTLCFGFLLARWLDDYIKLDTRLIFIGELVFNERLRNNFLRLALRSKPVISHRLSWFSQHEMLLDYEHMLLKFMLIDHGLLNLPQTLGKQVTLLTSHVEINRCALFVLKTLVRSGLPRSERSARSYGPLLVFGPLLPWDNPHSCMWLAKSH